MLLPAPSFRPPKSFSPIRCPLSFLLSQTHAGRRRSNVNTPIEALAATAAQTSITDLENLFSAHYARVARVIARVTRDPARAEELAVEVFLRWPSNQLDRPEAWLYRAAVRAGLDELRRQTRRSRYERMLSVIRRRSAPTPEQIHIVNQEQERVRAVLTAVGRRRAEMLVLRAEGLTYAELASVLVLNPASVGTLISRAQQAFRKEYIRRYGTAAA